VIPTQYKYIYIRALATPKMTMSVAKTVGGSYKIKLYFLAVATLKMATSVAKTWWLLQNKIMYFCTCHLEDGNSSGQNMLVVATK
jgi:hypothetical protein